MCNIQHQPWDASRSDFIQRTVELDDLWKIKKGRKEEKVIQCSSHITQSSISIAKLLNKRMRALNSSSPLKSVHKTKRSVEVFYQTITKIPQPLSASPLLNALGDFWKRGPNLPPRDEIAPIMLSHFSIKSCVKLC
jgi:hypothetical protein